MNKKKIIERIFKMVDDEKKVCLDNFFLDHINIEYKQFKKENEIELQLNFKKFNDRDNDLLRIYTGYNFKNINNILRNRWNYEENGNEVRKEEFLSIAEGISNLIDNNQQSIGNIVAFRGVDINYFCDYGIKTIEDLKKLQGLYLIDEGFVSTSLIEDKCFFNKKNNLENNYNIKIVYMIPEEFEDGIYLGTDNTSYNKNQYEYLINTWNISRICNVKIEKEYAILHTMLIPKYVYDDYYDMKKKNNRIK